MTLILLLMDIILDLVTLYIALSSIVPLPLMALLLNKYQLTRNF